MLDDKLFRVNAPKAHHVVPEFYLRRFALDGEVELVDRHDFTKRFRTSPDKALVHNHFYTVDTEAGRDPAFETYFANVIEAPAARAIRRLVDEHAAMSLPRLRDDLSAFLSFQFVRGPSAREASLAIFKAEIQRIMLATTPKMLRDRIREEEHTEPTDEEVNAAIAFARDTTKYKIGVSNEANLHVESVLPLALDFTGYFFKRRWRLVEFDEPALLTGDEPVALVGRPLIPGELLGLAVAPEIVFPVDPRHAFVMVRPDKRIVEGRTRGSPEIAAVINRHVAFACHRFIVQPPGLDVVASVTVPERAPAVRLNGDEIILQPRMSVDVARRRAGGSVRRQRGTT